MDGRVIAFALSVLGVGAQAPAPAPPLVQTDRSPRPGVGDLLVAPQRLILEGGTRSGELFLQNTGPRTATYRVSFIQMAMGEDGALRELEAKAPGGKYADEIVRFSPRQVTLEPGATQTLRVSLRLPEALPPGEYRSHLVFRAVPEAEPVRSRDAEEAPAQGIAVRLTPIYGVAIPVIVRHGATAASVAWASAAYRPGEPGTVEATLARSGNQSLYGNLVATFHPAGGAEPVIVSRMTMAAVYDGLPRRRFTFPLNLPQGLPARGTLHLAFLHPDTGSALAETRLELR